MRWKVFFLYLWQDKPLWVELKTNWGVIFITILLHFHYFISLETANTHKSEMFPLRISLGNVNALVVTFRYPQIYNFSFRKQFLETLSVYLSRILTTSWRTVPLAVPPPCIILVDNTWYIHLSRYWLFSFNQKNLHSSSCAIISILQN